MRSRRPLKKSAAEILDDLKTQVDFLTEAGAGFVLARPRGPAESQTGAPGHGQDSRGPSGPEVKRPLTPAEDREFDDIERRVRACTMCPLHKLRTHAVPGEGNRGAELMFVGEAPGRDEDAQGRPFVGRAGQLLRRIIAAMTFEEREVYITNVVKCRPPENLVRQIELIKPKVIVTLGRTPTDVFITSRLGMSALRGNFGDYGGIPVMPTFHPSYLVRNEGNRDLRRMVWEDMQKVMVLLGRK
jgi:uracil-DNA glycosylase family 4